MSARRAALASALVLAAALAVVVALRTPWTLQATPPGGHAPLDPTAGIPAAAVRRAQSFGAALRPASLANALLDVAVAGVLGLTPLGARLVDAVARPLARRWRGPRAGRWIRLVQVPVAVLLLTVIAQLVLTPLSAYAEVVEHRYGLSTESWALWVRDIAVSTLIDALVVALGALLLVGLARRLPRTWWAVGAALAALLVVLGSFVYPVFVEPAFNSFTPLAAGPLRTQLLDLARENGTPVQDVLVSDASRRTTALNAYVSGFGSTRRIVLYDTLLRQLPDDQVESIVAHELGHVAADDVLTGTVEGALGGAAAVALLGWLLGAAPLLRRSGARGPGDPRVVPLVLFLVAVGTLLGTPVENTVSRQIEARADLHSLDLYGHPAVFQAWQRTTSAVDLQEPSPPVVWHLLFGNHPTAAQRVEMARNWARLHPGTRP